MRPADPSTPPAQRRDLKVIRSLLPYLWEYRSRVLWALGCLILAKAATVSIPLMLKGIVDRLDVAHNLVLMLPIAFLIGYGAMRLASSAFSELRDAIFAKVTQRAIRRVALQVFRHLHRLALRFHLARHRARLARHQLFALLHAVQRAAHAGRDRPRRSDPAREIPDRLRRHHLRHRRPLHHLYADGDRVAHEVPSDHE